MLSALQPSRPKVPQQSAHAAYAQQQRRAIREAAPPQQGFTSLSSDSVVTQPRPRSQIEAMPPFGTTTHPSGPFCPMPTLYNSAVRHPVFFTQSLKKPPFPLPQVASQGWSPVASGYIMEQRKVGSMDSKTKL